MSIRTCPHCKNDRVLTLEAIPHVYYGMSKELRKALSNAENNPYINHLCTACKSEVRL